MERWGCCSRRQWLVATSGAGAGLGGLLAPFAARAELPSGKPVTTLYPYAAGSGFAGMLRAIGDSASKLLGAPAIFQDKPGALGKLAISALASAPADGCTLLWAADTMLSVLPLADPTFKFEQGKDYAPVLVSPRAPYVAVINPGLTYKDLNGLVSHAKGAPGKVTIAHSGLGAANHIASEALAKVAGIEVLLVPYRGASAGVLEVLAGRVDMMLVSGDTARPHIESGKLIGIATTGDTRWDAFPNLPTLRESGFAVTSYIYFGLVARAETPSRVIRFLEEAYLRTLKEPAIVQLLAKGSYEMPADAGASGLSAIVKRDIDMLSPVVKGIKFN